MLKKVTLLFNKCLKQSFTRWHSPILYLEAQRVSFLSQGLAIKLVVWLCVVALALSACGPRAGAAAGKAGLPSPDQTASEPLQETSPVVISKTPTEAPTEVPLSPSPEPATALPSPSPTFLEPEATVATPAPMLLTCRPEKLAGTGSDICYLDGQLSLERPIAPPGRDTVDVAYRYGSTQGGQRETHNGVEFLNSHGTPVLAAADGVVVLAENDLNKVLGLYYNFYGNLVVIEHQLPGHSQPVYTLYGHLAEFHVQPGQEVKAGEQIGLVGMGGAATGSHLHFEVRFGENSYQSSRNPEIWLKPLLDENGRSMGALAGRILDTDGSYLETENIVLELLSPDGFTVLTRYIFTYQEKRMLGQLPWEESFGIGDLPAGTYRVSFVQRGMQSFLIEIKPGQLAVVTFRV